jgi:TP901 family phage tail tape measure protein
LEDVYKLYVEVRAFDYFSNIFKSFGTTAKIAEQQMKSLQLAMKSMGMSGAEIRQVSRDLDSLARARQFNRLASDLTAVGMTADKIAGLAVQLERVAAAQKQIAAGKDLLAKGGLSIAAGVGIGAALVEPIKNAAEFQKSLTQVQIATGANTAQMQQLQRNAMLGGLDTGLSSVMVTEVQKAMSQSGLPLSALMNKTVFDQYLKFADLLYQRNGTPVDVAAASAVQMSHEYQLYSNPKQLADFQNRLWQTLAVTHTQIQPFANIFSYFAGTANRLGINADQALAMESFLIRSGLAGNGRSGGADIKDFLQRAASPASKEAAALMKQYGLLDKNGQSVFFQNGKFVGLDQMIDIMQRFSARFHGNRAAEENAIKVIWGQQGGQYALALSGSNARDMNRLLQQQISAVPGIETAQAMQMNTVSGQWQRLKVGWQDVMTNLGMPQLGSVQSFLKTINDIFAKVINFQLAHPALMKLIGDFAKLTAGALAFRGSIIALSGAGRMLSGAFRLSTLASDLIGVGKSVRPLIRDFGVLGGTLRVVGRGIGAIGGWVGRLTGLSGPVRLATSVLRAGGRVYDSAGRGVWYASRTVGRWTGTAGRAVGRGVISAGRVIGEGIVGSGKAIAAMAADFAKLSTNIAVATARMTVFAARTIAVKAAQMAASIATKAWSVTMAIFNAIMAANPITLIVVAIAGLIAVIVLLVTHWKQVSAVVSEVWAKIKQFGADIGGWFSKLWHDAIDAGSNIVRGLWQGISQLGGWIATNITNWAKQHIPGPILRFFGIQSPSRLMAQYGQYIAQGLAVGINKGSRDVAAASGNLANAAMPDLSGMMPSLIGLVGTRTSSGPAIHINNLTIQASDEAGGRAAANAFLQTLGEHARVANMSRPIGPNKLAFGPI